MTTAAIGIEAVVDDNAAEWFRTWLLADQAQTKQEEVNAEASKLQNEAAPDQAPVVRRRSSQ